MMKIVKTERLSRKTTFWKNAVFIVDFEHILLFFLVFLFFFSIRVFFTDTDDSQDIRGPSFIPLYHFHPLTNIQTFRHLCATLHVRWLSHVFNCTASRLLLDDIYHLIELPFD